jgi:uncharacterized protein (TIRG00374 family)
MNSSPPPALSASAPSGLRRILPRLAVSLLMAGAFAWALNRGGLPLSPPATALPHLRWWAVPAFVALTSLGIYFRTYRWVYLLRPISPRVQASRAFGASLVGYGAVFFAPLRLGEVVRPYLMAQDGEITFAQGLGTVAAERIIDGLVMVLITAVALASSKPISPLPDHVGSLPIPVSMVPGALISATVLFTLAFAAMAGLYATRGWAAGFTRRALGRFSPRLAELLARWIERLAQGFAFLPSWRSTGPFLRDTVLFWLVGGAAQWALLRGVGLTPTLAESSVTMGVIALGSLLPAGPGFFGAYQVATYTSMAMYFAAGDVTTLGAMFVFTSYASHVVLCGLSCVLGFWLLSRPPRAPAALEA